MCDSKQCLLLINLPSPAPGDYTSIDMMLTFDSGNIQITVPVGIVDDGIHENAEELSVHLSIANGVNVATSPEETTIQIVDNGKKH